MGKSGRRMRSNQQAIAEKLRLEKIAADKEFAINDKKRMASEEAKRGRGFRSLATSKYEREAGVTAPGFEGFRDRDTGKLLSDYVINPFTGEASQRLRGEALSTGPSALTQLQLDRQGAEEAKMRGDVGLRQQAEQSNAMSNLMRTGGLGGGARTSLARSGMRDALMAKQGVAGQGVMSRFGINETDMKRKQDLLGQTADLERQADVANLDTLKGDVQRGTDFDVDRYKNLMGAWGAEQTAKSTVAAGAASKSCFDLEAKISMADGTEKEISKILCGDEVLAGGVVLSTHLFGDPAGYDLYTYRGTLLTGSHAVFENNKWIRVRDSKIATLTGIQVPFVMNLVTEKHLIISNDTVFSDNEETDENFADENKSLAALNEDFAK